MNCPCKSKEWSSISFLKAGLGTVRIYSPTSLDELQSAVEHCISEKIRLLPVGNGSNIIGSDQDNYNLALLSLENLKENIILSEGRIIAQAGQSLLAFVRFAAKNNLGGMASLAGIPGSLGGCLAMNAGALKCEISAFVDEMHGINLECGVPWNWTCEMNGWAYRHSPVPNNVCVTSCVLRLKDVEVVQENILVDNELKRRRAVTPAGHSCGSIFKNPQNVSAGMLLEQAGCKNMSIGPFSVSSQHANWVVNLSGKPGNASDCQALIQKMQAMVLDKHGIRLVPEVRFIDSI